MLELVIPRTDEIGACAIFDAAGAHNKLVEAFFLSTGRTAMQIYGGATGIKQVGDDENFNGRKKRFCKRYVAKARLDALLKVPEES